MKIKAKIKEIRCEEIVRHGLQLFPNLTREEFFDKKFIPSDKFKEFIRELKNNVRGRYSLRIAKDFEKMIDKLAGKELIEDTQEIGRVKGGSEK